MKIRFLIFLLSFFFFAAEHLLLGWEFLDDAEWQDREITVFRIKVAADSHYIERSAKWYESSDGDFYISRNENWKGDLADLIRCLNERFEEQGVEVRFEIVEILEWRESEGNVSLRELLEDLVKKIPLSGCDLTIALTARIFDEKSEKGGFYDSRGYILIRDFSPFFFKGNAFVRKNKDSWTLALLLHEVGHYFLGPSHSSNSNSLMCGYWPLGFSQYFLEEEVERINKIAPIIKTNRRGAV